MQQTDFDPSVLAREIDRFGETWNYDVSYMHALARAAPASYARFGLVGQIVDHTAAPAEALAAASLVGVLSGDCGPCVQISADMAAAAGVAPEVIRAILAGDPPAMGETAALVWRFARASLARDLETSDPLRDEIRRRWGEAGLAAIALQITVSQMYPTLKYALGYGQACSKVVVGGVASPVAHAAAVA